MRPVWAVPFCSYAKEPHWVVAYIDPGNFVTMRNPKSKRVYIGKVLNILKQGKGNNGSITEADGVTGISALSLRVYRNTFGGCTAAILSRDFAKSVSRDARCPWRKSLYWEIRVNICIYIYKYALAPLED